MGRRGGWEGGGGKVGIIQPTERVGKQLELSQEDDFFTGACLGFAVELPPFSLGIDTGA